MRLDSHRQLCIVVLAAGLSLAGCGDDDPPGAKEGEVCNVDDDTPCEGKLSCEPTTESDTRCLAPIVLKGRVFDLASDANIAGARVLAQDANQAPESAVVVSGEDGVYELPITRVRGTDGSFDSFRVALRADASGYDPFPSGLRTAISIEINDADAVLTDGQRVVELPATDIGLLALADAASRTASIQGHVSLPGTGLGVNVIAESAGKGYASVPDSDGNYQIFNLPAGDYTVTAYAFNVTYENKPATLAAGATETVDLGTGTDAPGTLVGAIQIVSLSGFPAGTEPATSVILVVASTFDEAIARGVAPTGLRAPELGTPPNITTTNNTFTINGIPPGTYKVLAAFEDDYLVRDVSTIGGTAVLEVTIPAGGTVDKTSTPFKITTAIQGLSPGASGIEVLTAAPTLSWNAVSAAQNYDVQVVDALGVARYTTNTSSTSIPYAGDPLVPGMYYQLRVVANGASGHLSASEDLKGVFIYQP
jgi:hypothetical protein